MLQDKQIVVILNEVASQQQTINQTTQQTFSIEFITLLIRKRGWYRMLYLKRGFMMVRMYE